MLLHYHIRNLNSSEILTIETRFNIDRSQILGWNNLKIYNKNLFLELSWMVWWLVAFAPPYTCLWCRSGELLSSSEISRWEIESNSQVKWTLIRYQSIKMAQMVGKSSCSCYSTHLEVTNSSTGHGLELGCGLIFLFTHYGNKLCIACDLVSCKSTSDNEIIWSQKRRVFRGYI